MQHEREQATPTAARTWPGSGTTRLGSPPQSHRRSDDDQGGQPVDRTGTTTPLRAATVEMRPSRRAWCRRFGRVGCAKSQRVAVGHVVGRGSGPMVDAVLGDREEVAGAVGFGGRHHVDGQVRNVMANGRHRCRKCSGADPTPWRKPRIAPRPCNGAFAAANLERAVDREECGEVVEATGVGVVGVRGRRSRGWPLARPAPTAPCSGR